MEAVFYIESLTNDRLREEIGNLFAVPNEDRITGPSASILMASFTHCSVHYPSRFSNGEYGLYYAARELETAVKETVYHRERFFGFTNEPSCKITMRVYKSKNIVKPLKDLRESAYQSLISASPDDYRQSQEIGRVLKTENSWGIVYHSVRHKGGECVAILRPPAVPLPLIQTKHLEYIWNGVEITHVFEIGSEIPIK
jgi:hypothetical protein